MSKSAIIFLPETGMYPYARTLFIFADSLKQAGYNIFLVSCDNFLPRCIMQSACRFCTTMDNASRVELCKKCKKNSIIASNTYGFTEIKICDYIDTKDSDEIQNIFPGNVLKWPEIEFDGCKVGQIAIHDLMIEQKVLDTKNLNDSQQLLYKQYIMTMCYIIDAVSKIIDDKQPEIFLTFNPYCQNQAVLYACKKYGIIYKSITNITHLGSNYSCFQISDSTFTYENMNNAQNFDNSIAISEKNVLRNYEDSLYRMFQSGSHIFSSSKKDAPEITLKKLSLDPQKKIIVAFTGSYDERLGIDIYLNAWGTPLNLHEIFKTQIEWLLFLCELARNDDTLQFVFRIHPREGRDGGSVHLRLLREALKVIPQNVKIVWPETPVSSYDLLEIMDLCLISTSTMGIECNRVGIPAMSYTRNLSYPNEGYIPIPKTKEEYRIKMYELLNKQVRLDDFVLASRFYNWKTFIPCVDMEGQIKKDFEDSNYWPKCPDDKIELINNILEHQKTNIFTYNIARLKKDNNSSEIELCSNLKGVKVLILAFMLASTIYKTSFFSKVVNKIRKLLLLLQRKLLKKHFSENVQKSIYEIVKCLKFMPVEKLSSLYRIKSSILRKSVFFYFMDNKVILFYKGKQVERYSPLLYRLCKLYSESINSFKLSHKKNY